MPPPSAREGPDALYNYNVDLHEHYLDDFEDAEALAGHIADRIRFLLARKDRAIVEAALRGVEPKIDWWAHAKAMRREAAGVG